MGLRTSEKDDPDHDDEDLDALQLQEQDRR